MGANHRSGKTLQEGFRQRKECILPLAALFSMREQDCLHPVKCIEDDSAQKRHDVNDCTDTIRVCFLFHGRNREAMGGAEMSMLRMLRRADPNKLDASVLIFGSDCPVFRMQLADIGMKVIIVSGVIDLFSVLRKNRPEVLYMFARLHAAAWSLVGAWAGISTRLIAERGSGSSIVDRLSHILGNVFADGFITNSIAARNRAIRSFVPEKKIWVVYNGIDDVELGDSSNTCLDKLHGPNVVCLANIRPLKEIETLLMAIKHLQCKYPHARAILIGEDFTKGKFFAQAKMNRLEESYVWLGPMSDPLPTLNKADAFVLSSRSEGMPTSILEAMLLCKPVIASAVGGVPELIQNGVTGLLFQPGDWKTLADLLDRVFGSPTLAIQLGNNARKHVLQNHSVEQMLLGHYKIFQDCEQRNRESL